MGDGMKKVDVYVVGYPKVMVDGETVVFPFKKAEAAFYLLMLEKQVERLAICHMLWPEMTEEKAKRNLRNTIYTIRKVLGVDIFDGEKRAHVKINLQQITLHDYDHIIRQDEGYFDALLAREETELLKGFYVSGHDELEDWLSQRREAFRESLKRYLLNMCQMRHHVMYQRIKGAQKRIAMDEFDETSYVLLMKLYQEEKNYQKCMEVFHRLEDLLEEELGILPSKETIDFVDDLMNERQRREQPPEAKGFTFGREDALYALKTEWLHYTKKSASPKVLLLGEAGIGKTNLVEHFQMSLPQGTAVYKIQCFQLEQNYYFESFRTVMDQISHRIKQEKKKIPADIISPIASLFPSYHYDEEETAVFTGNTSYEVIENAFIALFYYLSKHQKTLLIIEDIHWIDKMSFQIIKALLCKPELNMMVIMTSRFEVEAPIQRFLQQMNARKMLQTIELQRFTLIQTREFIRRLITIEEEQVQFIYRQSEGNPLFIIEYINNLQQNKDFDLLNSEAGDVIRSRIISIPREAVKILEIAAVFLDNVQVDALLTITGNSKIELMELLDDLVSRRLLVEHFSPGGELQLHFSHNKIKEFVTEEMSKSKKVLLHKRFAEYYEAQLKQTDDDSEHYPRIMYHHQESRNRTKYFEYRLKRFAGLVRINHEMFPEINEKNDHTKTAIYLDKEEIEKELNLIQEEYETIGEYESQEGFKEIQLVYLFTMGRLQVDVGNHQTGRQLIANTIQLAEELKNHDYQYKGWFKLVHMGINAFDLQEMAQALNAIEAQLARVHDEGALGKWLRLKGYYEILCGNHEAGTAHLQQSISVFEKSLHRQRYLLSEAAAHLYLGESQRLQQQFSKAVVHYKEALKKCTDKKLYSGMAYTSASIGRVYYEMGDIREAQQYLTEAKGFYSNIIFMWGRYLPDAFLSLIHAQLRDEQKALEHFKIAQGSIQRMANLYDQGVLCRVKAELLALIKEFDNRRHFDEIIAENSEQCCRNQQRCFDKPALAYEKKRMDILLQDPAVHQWFQHQES